MAGFFCGDGKLFEGFEEGLRAVWVLVEMFRGAGMYSYGRVAETGFRKLGGARGET